MANNGAQVVLQEPLFYGSLLRGNPDHGKGLKAEDFISRVEDFQLNSAWDDATTAARAISYLRAEAREWFEGLKLTAPAQHDLARDNFRVFRTEFVQSYFKVKSTHDLGIDFHNIKQKEGESAHTFGTRVTTTLNKFNELCPLPDLNPARAAALQATGLAIRDAAATQAMIRAFDDALAADRTTRASESIRSVFQLFVRLLFKDGLRNPRLRETAARLNAANVPIRDMIRQIEQAEQALTTGTLSKVSEVTETEVDHEEETAAEAAVEVEAEAEVGAQQEARGDQQVQPRHASTAPRRVT